MAVKFDLVTGGAGFIGAHLVARLVEDGRTVRVLDDMSTGQVDRLAPYADQVELVEGDLVTEDLRSVVSDVERVFHLAAVPSVLRSVREPIRSHESNASGTLRLLVAARDAGVKRFVHSSSSSIYGDTPGLPKRETMPTRPLSPYGVAKLAAEGYVRVFATLYGMRTVSLRYFNVFGPGQDPNSAYAAVIPLFVRRALAGQAVPVRGDGEQMRDFTYVENVIEANMAAATAESTPGAAFNIAAGAPHSVNQLIDQLSRCLAREVQVEHVEPVPGDIRDSFGDISAARAELGWEPHVAFDEGLSRTVRWYEERLSRAPS